MSWDPNAAATTRPSAIDAAVWSPCNRFIAVTWRGTVTVDVLDSVTLQRLQTLKSPQDVPTMFRELAFSPDSRVLTYAGCTHRGQGVFVVSWDLQTGGIASTIWQYVSGWAGAAGKAGRPPPPRYIPRKLSITANGGVVGVHTHRSNVNADTPNTFIFDVASGVYTHSHSFGSQKNPLLGNIWTQGEFLRFATANTTSITIWEVGSTPDATPKEVRTLPAPGGFDLAELPVQLLPAPCRLALVAEEEVLVWDTLNSKFLLRRGELEASDNTKMCFSSNGRFFAYSTIGSEIPLWKESPTGYVLHQKFASSTPYPEVLLSPNGERIIAFGGPTIRSWRTEGPTTPPPDI